MAGSIVNFLNAARSYRGRGRRSTPPSWRPPLQANLRLKLQVASIAFGFGLLSGSANYRLAMLYKSIWSARVSALKEKSVKFSVIR
jgi:hypothetical protein